MAYSVLKVWYATKICNWATASNYGVYNQIVT
jgi:hypothetical protein